MRVWGEHAPLSTLLGPPRPDEEVEGESHAARRLVGPGLAAAAPLRARTGMSGTMRSFDLLGDLPHGPSTTVLEASAGTGKTYALAGAGHPLRRRGCRAASTRCCSSRSAGPPARSSASGCATSWSRPPARSTTRPTAGDNALLAVPGSSGDADELAARRHRVRDALAGFDAATIATTHQFCRLVLASLGVAGDSDAGVTLVESLDELVAEVVDDLYLRRFGHDRDTPVLTREAALALAREVVGNPHTTLTPGAARARHGRRGAGSASPATCSTSSSGASAGSASSATTTCSPGSPRPSPARRARRATGCAGAGGS